MVTVLVGRCFLENTQPPSLGVLEAGLPKTRNNSDFLAVVENPAS